MSGFPNTMSMTQAPAVVGQLASLNPRHALAGAAGAWTAGIGGITVGCFAWADATSTNSVLINNAASGVPSCVVSNELSAMVTTYLSETSLVIPKGYPVPGAYVSCDIWVKNTNASAAAAVGNKAFAKLTDGTVQFAAAGSTISGYVETKWIAYTTGAAGDIVKICPVVID